MKPVEISAPVLHGRHALVCGASSGIGRAAARALARRGAVISLLARRRDLLESLREELRAEGAAEARVLVADLDDPEAAGALVAAHRREHGPVHILVHNTGGAPSGPILDAAPEAFLSAFRRHVLSAHRLLREVLPDMRAAGWGRIVNVLSTSVREPIPGLGVSNTIRGAMAAWAKTASRELPPGVTINNVLPGYTDTERLGDLSRALAGRQGRDPSQVRADWIALVPEGRLAHPDEIAAAIVFLASPEASFIRGQSLAVDGGRLSAI